MNTSETGDSPSDRGRQARWPSQIPFAGWKDVLWRVYGKLQRDRVMLVAAGVTYYFLLALFPALAAFVSLYGFVADPSAIADQISYLGGVLPESAMELIREQLNRLASRDQNALSIGFIVGLLIALWSANAGVKSSFSALNVAYDEKEKRGFFRLNLLALAFSLASMLVAALLIAVVGLIPAVLALVDLGGATDLAIRIVRWPLTFLVIALAIAMLYRYGPSREVAKWRWVSWGSALATLVWFAASIAFSYYLQNFSSYDATYGSLGAIVGFMVWTWISVMILLVGAEIDAEMEHQTERDSTPGKPEPMGERGAVVADTLGKTVDED